MADIVDIMSRRKPDTLCLEYAVGLEALGYVRDGSLGRYLAYRHPNKRKSKLYVSKAGALRVGRIETKSSALFKTYVLSAPELRPLIYTELAANPPPAYLTSEIIALELTNTVMAHVAVIRLHVKAWLEERGA